MLIIPTVDASALGPRPPWSVEDVRLHTAGRRIDFEIACQGGPMACPAYGAAHQPLHDRLRRSWRDLDFFQFETWLHREVPRVSCAACGKTTQVNVPWARAGSGITAALEAQALTLCRDLPVRQAAALLRCSDKRLWRRISLYVLVPEQSFFRGEHLYWFFRKAKRPLPGLPDYRPRSNTRRNAKVLS